MKKISIIFLAYIAILAIILNNNGIQAADEDNFEQGKYINLILTSRKDFVIFAFAHFFKKFLIERFDRMCVCL